ncbi:MAG: rRNA cytosine-C5-methylase [Propionibacteriaceae bacterium]|jgi:16S rRNA (cytosine967-C5)-methyltransferase|nr:rRNA cytosine-C5-methylase [Propionibacteriaceae bacterium]
MTADQASPARRLAFQVLRQVNAEGAYANLALRQALARADLDQRDAALATELVAGVCRHQGVYDRILVAAAGRPLGSLQPALVDLLRLSCHQLLRLRPPPAVAVSASVDLARATIGARVTGLVNAVLRRVAESTWPDWLERLSQGQAPIEQLALRTSHPAWIAQAYVDLLGWSEAEPALQANNQPPSVDLVCYPGLSRPQDLVAAGAEPGRWSDRAVRVQGDPARWPALVEGRAGVQDEGSQLIALGLSRAPAPAGPWLDLCAGPGGKTALLWGAALAADEPLVALELHPHRTQLVAQAVRAYPRQPLLAVADGRRPPLRPGSFSRVLADVPCTGLGSLRRRPESRWRRRPQDLAGLTELQAELLAAALAAGRSGAVVAYVTCSPHRDETERVVETVLATRSDVDLIEASQVWPALPEACRGPYLQLWPHRHGLDAMFCALLRRR